MNGTVDIGAFEVQDIPDTKQILYVASQLTPEADDAFLVERLRTQGYDVMVQDDDRVNSTDADGKDLVLISESVLSSKVGSTFTATEVPVLTWEPYLYDDLKMTGSTARVDYGFDQGQSIHIADSSHPITAALSGLQTVYQPQGLLSWGMPTQDADKVATLANDDDKATIFVYEAGDSLVDGSLATASRIGFFFHNRNDEPLKANATGLQLFDNAIKLALEEPVTPFPPEPSEPQVLFVTNTGSISRLSAGDQAIKSFLEGRGFSVMVVEDGLAQGSDAENKDFVLISESVLSGEVGDVFTQVDVPIINLEPYLNDDLDLTGNQAGIDFGFDQGETSILITDPSSDLAAGLAGEVQVYSQSGNISWGNPNDNAVRVASLDDDPTRASIFAYEAGAGLVGGMAAPEARVSLFLHNRNNEFTQLTPEGEALFGAAVDFVMA